MTLLDANVLLAAWNSDDPNHPAVSKWLEATFARREAIGIPWLVRHAFVRIATNPRIFPRPLSLEEAFDLIQEWSNSSYVYSAEPGPHHGAILREIAVQSASHGSRLTDAILAAIAMENGATLASLDRDFRKFPGLKWIDPLGRDV